MASKVGIINLALVSLRAATITEPLENTENGRKMDAIYDLKLDALLRSHPWSFAKKESALSLVAGTPVLTDYTYIYNLPSDFTRLLKTSVEPDYAHKIKGRQLYSNSSSISIEYIYFCDEPSLYDAEFIDAFAALLAAELCYAITGDKALVDVKWQEFRGKYQVARSVNGQETTPDNPQADAWLNARGGGRYQGQSYTPDAGATYFGGV